MEEARQSNRNIYREKLAALNQAKESAEMEKERELDMMKEKIEHVSSIIIKITFICHNHNLKLTLNNRVWQSYIFDKQYVTKSDLNQLFLNLGAWTLVSELTLVLVSMETSIVG